MPTFDIEIGGRGYQVDAPSEEALPEIVDHIASTQVPESTSAGELLGAAARGLGPTGLAAGTGAILGSPFGPGGMATGARIGVATLEGVSLAADLGTLAVNKLFGTRFNSPTVAFKHLADMAGLPEAKTDTAKMVEEGARMVGSTLGFISGGALLKGATSPLAARIGTVLSSAPKEQLVAAAAAGAGGEGVRQAVEAAGGTEGEQAAASFLASIATGHVAGKAAGFKLGAGAAANPLLQAAEREGVDLTTSMVNQPKGLVGKYMQTLGTNIPILGTTKKMEQVAAQRTDAVLNALSEYGVDHGVSPDMKAAVMESLTDARAAKLNDYVTQKKDVLSLAARNGLEVPTVKTTAEIESQVNKLKSINPEFYAPVIDRLESFGANLAGKGIEEVEGNRQILRNMFKNPELASIRDEGQKATDAVYNALRDDMGDFILAQEGQSAKAAWQKADTELAKMVKEIDRTSLKSVLRTGGATPEVVGKLLFSKKDSELNLLLNNLDEAGKANAKAAILQEAANRATDKRTGLLSANSFTTKLGELSRPMKKLFSPEEQARFKGLADVLEASKYSALFAPDAPTGIKGVVPQSAILMGMGAAGVMGAIGKVASIGIGWRAYESKMIRNLLEKISQNPPEKAALIKRLVTGLEVGYVRQVGNDMIKKGVPITFDPANAKTEQVGQGNVTTDMAHGFRAVSTDGKKQRLYGPDNKLMGVFKDLDMARLYADQHVVKQIKPQF